MWQTTGDHPTEPVMDYNPPEPHATGSRAAELLTHPGALAWYENPTPQYVWDKAFAAGKAAARNDDCTCRTYCGDTPEDEGGTCKGLTRA